MGKQNRKTRSSVMYSDLHRKRVRRISAAADLLTFGDIVLEGCMNGWRCGRLGEFGKTFSVFFLTIQPSGSPTSMMLHNLKGPWCFLRNEKKKKTLTATTIASTEDFFFFYFFFLFHSKFALTHLLYLPFFSNQHAKPIV